MTTPLNATVQNIIDDITTEIANAKLVGLVVGPRLLSSINYIVDNVLQKYIMLEQYPLQCSSAVINLTVNDVVQKIRLKSIFDKESVEVENPSVFNIQKT